MGAHVSTAGGMPEAVRQGLELGCEAIQVFTRNQRQWTPKPLDPGHAKEFRAEGAAAGYLPRAVSHASYLINLCATDPAILRKSRTAFVDEIGRCAALGIPYLCIHPGSHLGEGEEAGLKSVAGSLKEALAATKGRRVMILLENTAGQGTNLGHRLEHLATLLKLVRGRRVGVCIDTCHLFAAGYDLRTKRAYEASIREIEREIGVRQVKAFHLNDSKFECGARRDRHEHIGQGEIGPTAFRQLMNDTRFSAVPGLLETPGGPDGYRDNLKRLKGMRQKK